VIVALDQGLSGTGWALFEDGVLQDCGNLYPPKDIEDWLIRSEEFSAKIVDFFGQIKTGSTFLMEQPAYHGSDAGQTVARSGSLVRLCYFSGMLHGYLRGEGYRIISVPVMKWKGQLPKAVVEKRIYRVLEKQGIPLKPKSHAIDAIGIGMWHEGDF